MAISLPQSLETKIEKLMETELTPQEIVAELDKFIIGQQAAGKNGDEVSPPSNLEKD